jgi:signal transduction histidine kinase
MGNVYLQLEEFDLKELAEECTDLFRLQVDLKNINLNLIIKESENFSLQINNDK